MAIIGTPEKKLTLMEKIIDAGNWKDVMPVTEEDTKKIKEQEEAYRKSLEPKTLLEWIIVKVLWPWVKPSYLP